MTLAAICFRFLIGIVFLLAGLSKLPRRQEFARAVRGYQLVSDRAAALIGRWLPPLELTAGTLLLFGAAMAAVSAVVALLLMIFAAAIAVNLARGREIDCGCFGGGVAGRIGWTSVIRNGALAAMAVVVLAARPTVLSVVPIVPSAGREPSSADAVAMAVAGVLAAIAALVGSELVRASAAARAFERRSIVG